ncbi:carboxypeptidase-like regulatory domain-containing protein [Dehalobacter sp. DCM]|uniref:carboxypeptidase-like regulatory domain-containing protein n=1 Tax=Dehalobacter sp. DCM TaxID=2907827 RepID=UPI0030819554|nr:carboxypeptidase-like regulatory domain-containing protein [Dehalobacter sp. DCM]
MNLPKLKIAGGVWDSSRDAIIKGAKLTLYGEDGLDASTESDDYGDFRFQGLNSGNYTLEVTADGYETVIIESIQLKKDSLKIVDIPMMRTKINRPD